ncbi:UDP:flavonoid glycosyltransferase YjiC (YdhE family) [Streptomyces sp. PanSC19]|uniref:glycosyltransferase n=1 Tax=Streptomyces sp. PanSC19 TaxID=1520455 RepID=UPI000F47C965|nr:glycosyltransferase [Streptomyces sp. PanSC19]ROQ36002.1 UDP:flavonoid glycosyltransferase YjiC (YdhE family) [Streptomyces sp. PanSC19]
MARVVVVSPPFHSHAQPMSVLAGSLARAGAEAYLACGRPFAPLARAAGARFVPLTVTRNANTGVARSTAQGDREAARLEEFLASTREGAVAALLAQSRHRREDMLSDPDLVLAGMRALHERLAPDWYVVDQLSYPVTLALHCLGLPFATFCPGHPTYLPHGPEALFGVPYAWPSATRPGDDELAELRRAARATERAFTREFARVARRHAPEREAPGRAFALASRRAVVFNYPPFPWLPERKGPGPRYVYGGHCVVREQYGPDGGWEDGWEKILGALRARARHLVLVALGTFLSARDDVLETVVRGILSEVPDAAVVVAAGDGVEALAHLAGPRVHIARTVPQRRLLGHVDAMVHHGGNNSFTECVASGVPALVLPFSSDQFSIAHDAERAQVGVCLDPVRLTGAGAGAAVRRLLRERPRGLGRWTAALSGRGPDWAARRLLRAMRERPDGTAPSRTPARSAGEHA